MYVRGDNLDASKFICGDSGDDLVPFACPKCRKVMVACRECDTIYEDPMDGQTREPARSGLNPTAPVAVFECPRCGYEFAFAFMQDERYRVEREHWLRAGLGSLLIPTPDP